MQIVSFSLPEKEVEQIIKLSEDEGCSRSQIIKQALDLYLFESKWQRLRKVGDLIARRLEIESDDDVERIAG